MHENEKYKVEIHLVSGESITHHLEERAYRFFKKRIELVIQEKKTWLWYLNQNGTKRMINMSNVEDIYWGRPDELK
jgi:hypothetical protein